jgi:hypothetical protein
VYEKAPAAREYQDQPRIDEAGREIPSDTYATTFYPDTLKLSEAVPVRIAAGAEIGGIDLFLNLHGNGDGRIAVVEPHLARQRSPWIQTERDSGNDLPGADENDEGMRKVPREKTELSRYPSRCAVSE